MDDEDTTKLVENACKNCGLMFPKQHDLLNHIDEMHVTSEPIKRKRRNSEGSISEHDIMKEMNTAMRISNDKRDELQRMNEMNEQKINVLSF